MRDEIRECLEADPSETLMLDLGEIAEAAETNAQTAYAALQPLGLKQLGAWFFITAGQLRELAERASDPVTRAATAARHAIALDEQVVDARRVRGTEGQG